VNSFTTAGKLKTLLLGIGQKGLFLEVSTFQTFFSANNQCNANQSF